MQKLSKEITHNDLRYYFKSSPKYFSCFKFPLKLLTDVMGGRIKLEKAKKNKKQNKTKQKEFKSDLNSITRGKYISKDQEHPLSNIKMLYKT